MRLSVINIFNSKKISLFYQNLLLIKIHKLAKPQSNMNLLHENAHAVLFQANINDLKKSIPSLQQQQLTTCISLLQAYNHSDANERLIAFISATDEPMRLEAIGKGFSLSQFLCVLSAIAAKTIPIEKLSPLLVGLSPMVFQQALVQLTPLQLSILKRESLTEPLQHQLTLFSHNYERLYEDHEKAILQIFQKLEDLKHEELSYRLLAEIEKRLDEIKDFAKSYLATIDQALAIAWTTNRLDLIKNLTQLKEHFHHQLHQKIGQPTTLEQRATGLYGSLEQSLYAIFGTGEELLNDHDAAIEGLAKFSIWYLPDYWEVGLLPSTSRLEDLELDSSKHNEQQRLHHRQSLFDQVQKNLTKLHLNSISDLKKFQIFSKTMLKEFIFKNQQLLQEP